MEFKAKRLMSLDVARGITIMGMIIVNNPGDPDNAYFLLQHAQWNGLHVADLGVPIFLFIVGISMAFSLGKKLERGKEKSALYKKIGYRSLILYGLGAVLNAFPIFHLAPFRLIDTITISVFMQTLQRIAISYFFGSIIYLKFRKARNLIIWILVLVVLYQIMLMVLPQPTSYETLYSGTVTDYIFIFGQAITATAIVLAGVLTGIMLRASYSKREKAGFMLIAGLIIFSTGLAASYFWPINMQVLSVSFVIVTIGFSLIVYSVLYWIIEIKNYDRWTLPFEIFGTNALFAFVGSTLFEKMSKVGLDNFITVPQGWGNGSIKSVFYTHSLLPALGPHVASILYAVLVMLFWLGLTSILYKRKVLIKV